MKCLRLNVMMMFVGIMCINLAIMHVDGFILRDDSQTDSLAENGDSDSDKVETTFLRMGESRTDEILKNFNISPEKIIELRKNATKNSITATLSAPLHTEVDE